MLDFIMNIAGLVVMWLLLVFIILLFIYLSMDRIARHMGCGNLFDKYIEMVIDWIRDAFRD
ncbi:MAG: hypothetical protein J6Y92_09750 [Lentisphaeria bacterium]|nr:hypothetical protein [Lentisphaeria bacterium]